MNDRLARKMARAKLSLQKPISPAELCSFEAAAGTTVPDDYREFLLTVANGGAKTCRLLPLSKWYSSYWSSIDNPGSIAEPSIVSPDLGDGWLDTLKIPDWSNRWDRDEWDPMLGTLAIAEIGCGLYYSIIVTGPHRGRVFSWGDFAAKAPCIYPQSCFSEWFESELDQLLAGARYHIFKPDTQYWV